MIAPAPLLAFLLDGLGGPEVLLVLLLVVMLFGGKKLPELARGLGQSLREFRKATSDVEREIKKAIEAPAYEPPKARPPVENTLPAGPAPALPPPEKDSTPPPPPTS